MNSEQSLDRSDSAMRQYRRVHGVLKMICILISANLIFTVLIYFSWGMKPSFNETQKSNKEAEVVNLEKRISGGAFVTMLYFSGLMNTIFGDKEKIMALIAGTGEVSLTAANIMANCKDASSGKIIDAVECFMTTFGSAIGFGITAYQVGNAWNGKRDIKNKFGNSELHYLGQKKTMERQISKHSPINVYSEMLKTDVTVHLPKWAEVLEIVQHTTPNGTTVNMAAGHNGTAAMIKPLGPKGYNTTKRSFVGWEDDHVGGLKVLANSKGYESYNFEDAKNWAQNSYGGPSPAEALYYSEAYTRTLAVGTRDETCEGKPAQALLVWEMNDAGDDWETEQDWCWGGCKTNCQFKHPNMGSCLAVQSGRHFVVQAGSSDCADLK